MKKVKKGKIPQIISFSQIDKVPFIIHGKKKAQSDLKNKETRKISSSIHSETLKLIFICEAMGWG